MEFVSSCSGAARELSEQWRKPSHHVCQEDLSFSNWIWINGRRERISSSLLKCQVFLHFLHFNGKMSVMIDGCRTSLLHAKNPIWRRRNVSSFSSVVSPTSESICCQSEDLPQMIVRSFSPFCHIEMSSSVLIDSIVALGSTGPGERENREKNGKSLLLFLWSIWLSKTMMMENSFPCLPLEIGVADPPFHRWLSVSIHMVSFFSLWRAVFVFCRHCFITLVNIFVIRFSCRTCALPISSSLSLTFAVKSLSTPSVDGTTMKSANSSQHWKVWAFPPRPARSSIFLSIDICPSFAHPLTVDQSNLRNKLFVFGSCLISALASIPQLARRLNSCVTRHFSSFSCSFPNVWPTKNSVWKCVSTRHRLIRVDASLPTSPRSKNVALRQVFETNPVGLTVDEFAWTTRQCHQEERRRPFTALSFFFWLWWCYSSRTAFSIRWSMGNSTTLKGQRTSLLSWRFSMVRTMKPSCCRRLPYRDERVTFRRSSRSPTGGERESKVITLPSHHKHDNSYPQDVDIQCQLESSLDVALTHSLIIDRNVLNSKTNEMNVFPSSGEREIEPTGSFI